MTTDLIVSTLATLITLVFTYILIRYVKTKRKFEEATFNELYMKICDAYTWDEWGSAYRNALNFIQHCTHRDVNLWERRLIDALKTQQELIKHLLTAKDKTNIG